MSRYEEEIAERRRMQEVMRKRVPEKLLTGPAGAGEKYLDCAATVMKYLRGNGSYQDAKRCLVFMEQQHK